MPIDKPIIKRAAQVLGSLAIQAVVFFTAAGHTDIPRAWLYFGFGFLNLIVNFIIFYRVSPDIIRERSEMKPGLKGFDKVFIVFYTLFLFLVFPAVAGLDAGRFHWSDLGIEFAVFGFFLYVIGATLIDWAIITNKYFETTVVVQKGQNVVSTGPYAIVRHPGYTGMILNNIAAPLIIGSAYALIPAAAIAVLFFFRTHYEDRTLLEELEGYAEYAKKVKYKLIPWVW